MFCQEDEFAKLLHFESLSIIHWSSNTRVKASGNFPLQLKLQGVASLSWWFLPVVPEQQMAFPGVQLVHKAAMYPAWLPLVGSRSSSALFQSSASYGLSCLYLFLARDLFPLWVYTQFL